MDGAQYEEPAAGTWVVPNLCASYSDTSEACVSEEVANDCQALAAAGCIELIVAESCPVQLSCARTVCPPTDPAPDSNCTANGLSCTLTTYTCPGTSTVITTEWAECLQSTWRVGVAGFVCPDPPAANNAALVGGVVGGCAALAIAAGVATYWLRGKNSATKKTVLTKGVDGASRA